MQKRLVAANWKMNGSLARNQQWLEAVLPQLDTLACQTLVCAPFVYLPQLLAHTAGSSMWVGAQNVAAQPEGAFTGEVSAEMLRDLGVNWCLIGHSERRTLFGETDDIVAQKARRLADVGITILLCVGETRQEREAGETLSVVMRQVNRVLEAVPAHAIGAVAYEPVWAIGTGLTATPEQAVLVHQAIRARFNEFGVSLPILYGGSMKPDNAQEFFAHTDIDGGLLGGAGLKAPDYLKVCQVA